MLRKKSKEGFREKAEFRLMGNARMLLKGVEPGLAPCPGIECGCLR